MGIFGPGSNAKVERHEASEKEASLLMMWGGRGLMVDVGIHARSEVAISSGGWWFDSIPGCQTA
jgi:hypothetical protein